MIKKANSLCKIFKQKVKPFVLGKQSPFLVKLGVVRGLESPSDLQILSQAAGFSKAPKMVYPMYHVTLLATGFDGNKGKLPI